MWAVNLLVLVACYFLGAFMTAYFMGKLIAGIDIRDYGSGNLGTSNVLRTLGVLPAALVLALDVFKGFFAVKLGAAIAPGTAWPILCGIAAIAGHNWPLYLKFKGGKGIATSFGVLLAAAPLTTLVLAAVWGLMLLAFRYISLASITAAAVLPLCMYISGWTGSKLAASLLLAAVAIYQHRSNIKRLLAGREYKLGEKARPIA